MKLKKIKDNQLINLIFLCFMLSTIMAYGMHAIMIIKNRQYVLWTYADYSINIGFIGQIFIYAKDVLGIILFLFLFIKKGNVRKIAMFFLGIVYYGIIILIISGMFNVTYIVAGIRTYLTFVVALMYFSYRIRLKQRNVVTHNNKDLNSIEAIDIKIYRCLVVALLVEFFLVFAQVFFFRINKHR